MSKHGQFLSLDLFKFYFIKFARTSSASPESGENNTQTISVNDRRGTEAFSMKSGHGQRSTVRFGFKQDWNERARSTNPARHAKVSDLKRSGLYVVNFGAVLVAFAPWRYVVLQRRHHDYHLPSARLSLQACRESSVTPEPSYQNALR